MAARRIGTRFSTFLGVLLLLVPGCQREELGTSSPDSSPSPEPVEDHMVSEFAYSGINELVNISDAAIIGTITEISEARWNSSDGKSWKWTDAPEGASTTVPNIYRDLSIVVEKVIFSDSDLPLKSGDSVVARIFGDGSATGEVVGLFGHGTAHFNQLYGDVRVESKVFVVMHMGRWPTWQRGTPDVTWERIVSIGGYWQGYWVIEGDQATNLVPARTVPLEPLIARMQTEREHGRDRSRDENTIVNPLG